MKYTIKRKSGISSLADRYEYRTMRQGEFGQVVYFTRRITAASMRRFYRLSNMAIAIERTKLVTFPAYCRLMKVS